MQRTSRFAVAAAIAMVGCDSNDLGNPEHVATWANAGSAVGAYSQVWEPIAFADGQPTFEDPQCPATTDDGTTVHILGGCTQTNGVMRVGSATVVRSSEGTTLTLDGYGTSGSAGRGSAILSGTATIHAMSATSHAFDLDLQSDVVHTIYSGMVEGTYGGLTTWNGSGTVERMGLVAPTGMISATTADERWDSDTCAGEPLAGTTTIQSGGHVAVVTYDGAIDCDAPHAARWSLDGVDRGAIADISCSASPGRSSPFVAIASIGLAFVLVARRRLQ